MVLMNMVGWGIDIYVYLCVFFVGGLYVLSC